jgi:hypothetical protein
LLRGVRELVKQAARAESVPTSEFIRRAINERIVRVIGSTAKSNSSPQ